MSLSSKLVAYMSGAKTWNTNIINNLVDIYEDAIDVAGDALATDILAGKTALVDGDLITGTIPSVSGGTYSVSSADQVIASENYLSGSVIFSSVAMVSGATLSVSDVDQVIESGSYLVDDIVFSSVAMVSAYEIIPSISAQVVTSEVYLTGDITIAAIPSEYIDTTIEASLAAEAADIALGKFAYVNGVLIEGTLT